MKLDNFREDRRPADLWYWKDWFSSFDLRACSLAARGLWMDMLGVMRDAETKGVLSASGKLIDSKDLAKITGATEDQVTALLDELEAHNVFSRLRDGAIINRRMYRESQISRARAEAGKKGAESRWQSDGKGDESGDGKRDGKPMAALESEDEYAITINKIKDLWCDFAGAHGLAKVQGVEKGSRRYRALTARLKDKAFDFQALLKAIAASPFLLGQKTDFKATFDWILLPSNYQKIIEGNYRGAAPSGEKVVGLNTKPVSAEEKEARRRVEEYRRGLYKKHRPELEKCEEAGDTDGWDAITEAIRIQVAEKGAEIQRGVEI